RTFFGHNRMTTADVHSVAQKNFRTDQSNFWRAGLLVSRRTRQSDRRCNDFLSRAAVFVESVVNAFDNHVATRSAPPAQRSGVKKQSRAAKGAITQGKRSWMDWIVKTRFLLVSIARSANNYSNDNVPESEKVDPARDPRRRRHSITP